MKNKKYLVLVFLLISHFCLANDCRILLGVQESEETLTPQINDIEQDTSWIYLDHFKTTTAEKIEGGQWFPNNSDIYFSYAYEPDCKDLTFSLRLHKNLGEVELCRIHQHLFDYYQADGIVCKNAHFSVKVSCNTPVADPDTAAEETEPQEKREDSPTRGNPRRRQGTRYYPKKFSKKKATNYHNK